jgi:hypothetical protein
MSGSYVGKGTRKKEFLLPLGQEVQLAILLTTNSAMLAETLREESKIIYKYKIPSDMRFYIKNV